MARHQQDPAKEAYWRKVLNRFAASGLSVREFCRREQLSEPSFYAWRRTIGERDDAYRFRPAFVRAVVSKEAAHGSSITIELATGCVLRFSGAHATEQVADLIVALQSRGVR